MVSVTLSSVPMRSQLVTWVLSPSASAAPLFSATGNAKPSTKPPALDTRNLRLETLSIVTILHSPSCGLFVVSWRSKLGDSLFDTLISPAYAEIAHLGSDFTAVVAGVDGTHHAHDHSRLT